MQKIFNGVIFLLFFLLPWQTIYLFDVASIAGEPSPFGVIGLYAVQVLLVIVALAFDLTGRGFKIDREAKRPVALTFLILATFIFSFIFSENKTASLGHALPICFAGLLFFLLLEREVSTKYAMAGFVAGLILPSILGFVQVATGGSFGSTLLGLEPRDAARLGEAVIQTSDGTRILRAYGSFPHPNIFGGYLAVGLISIFGLWPSAKERWQKIFLVGTGFILSASLILTFSRSAWLGLILAAIVGTMALKIKPVSRARSLVIPTAFLFITAVFISSMGVMHYAPTFSSRPGSNAEFESRSIDERVGQYQEFPRTLSQSLALKPETLDQSLALVSKLSFDLVIGHGPGTYPWANERAYPGKDWFEYQPIHNVFLLVFAELGILGVVAVLLWSSSIDKINFSRFPNRDAVTAFMMGNVILVILFFDHYLWSFWPGLALVAYVMALTVRLGSKS